MEMTTSFRFEQDTHKYFITTDGVERGVPSVTQVLGDLIPGWKASDWYLERGKAVHAAMAFLSRGIDFDFDPVIEPQITAGRKFFTEIKPVVLEVECQVYSERSQYAGTLDGIFVLPRGMAVIDWKASLDGRAVWQLAAYAQAWEDMGNKKIDMGCAIQLKDDGSYRMSEVYELRRPKQEWKCLLNVFQIRAKLRLTSKPEMT